MTNVQNKEPLWPNPPPAGQARLHNAGSGAAHSKRGREQRKIGQFAGHVGDGSSRDVATALAEQLGVAFVEAAQYPEMPILEERVSARFLQEHKALPLREDADVLELAMAEPNDAYAIKAFEMVTGRRVRPVLGVPADIDAAVERLYVTGRGGAVDAEIRLDGDDFNADVQQLKDLASEAPVIRMVSQIIAKALDVRASIFTSSRSRIRSKSATALMA